MRLALFGGTFDPIHCAHLAVAREAAEHRTLSRVLFVVASRPPHKSRGTAASYEDRYRMVEIGCEDEPYFEASPLEEGGMPSYSFDTIRKARSLISESDELFFLIGADAFAEVETWYRWREVLSLVEFIVVSRPGCAYSIPSGARVHRLESLNFAVSSSEIRRKLAAGEAPPEVPLGVLRYIREHSLYGAH